MAIIFIKPIRSRLDKALAYVENKNKTKADDEIYNDLHNALEYSVDSQKTERQFYVTGVNCMTEKAYEEMVMTQQRSNTRQNIIQGFHIIQSFAPDEGTPELIHNAGIEFAKRMFGEEFEVVVATHKNTGCLHNHLILNSCSIDGTHKYLASRDTYKQMRKVSDEICKENGLSVIENPSYNTHRNYETYMEEKNGAWTKDAIIRRDMDECILRATSVKGFYYEMGKLGYRFDFERKYPTVSHPDFERPRRMKTLGEDYTPEMIRQRMQKAWKKYDVIIPEQDDYSVLPKVTAYADVYVQFVAVIKRVKSNPKYNRNVDKFLTEETIKMNKLIEQQNLLCGNDIETLDQLLDYKQECKNEMDEILKARDFLRKELKAAEYKDDKQQIISLRSDIRLYTERLRLLRKRIATCERIEAQEPKIETLLEKIQTTSSKDKEVNEYESRRRRSGTNRQNDIERR